MRGYEPLSFLLLIIVLLGSHVPLVRPLVVVGCSLPSFCANFTVMAVSPLGVFFTAQTTGGISPLSFSWAFGDGDIGTGSSVSHTYASPYTYLVKLTTVDSGGATFTIAHDITVMYPPSKEFTKPVGPSWNSRVSCLASRTTIPGIIGNVSNTYGGADLSGAGTMSLVLKHTTDWPCAVLGYSVFVEIHDVTITNGPVTTTDCSDVNGVNSCDIVGNLVGNGICPACLPGTDYMNAMRWELERQWTADGLVSSNYPRTGQSLDVQGFMYYSFLAPSDSLHEFSGWYLELTAWKSSQISPGLCQKADFNVDGRVNLLDLSLFDLHYNTDLGEAGYSSIFDLNSDGRINLLDLSILGLYYGRTC